ncbi:MAG: hypothetical protein H6817_08985 [Phycisphaerales bacterium]|nr:hypothetical protein [Phycisphaerales bacterium]
MLEVADYDCNNFNIAAQEFRRLYATLNRDIFDTHADVVVRKRRSEGVCMGTALTDLPASDISPGQRRDAIIALLSVGLERFVAARTTDPQELSESGENGLELSVETRLSVARG